MNIHYSYLSKILFILLMTINVSNTASLHAPLKMNLDHRHSSVLTKDESTTPEPILSRRRPVLVSNEIRKRWVVEQERDEIQIPISETTDFTSSNSILTTEQTIITEISTDSIENTTMDIVPNNETDARNNQILTTIEYFISSTESDTLPLNVTDINQNTSSLFDDLATIEISNTSNETDSTMNSPEWHTTLIDENVTTSIHITQADITTIIEQDINSTTFVQEEFDRKQNDSADTLIDEDQYSNETLIVSSETTVRPLCDLSCQCSKECLYGFEIVNDTCQCNPPCENYQCFGNDICIVTSKGTPLCQPENGTEHDRPSRCYQPRDDGYHDEDIRYHDRWYYNPEQDSCHSFVYRGLGGNENNFQTLHQCNLECIICAPTPDPGSCLGSIRMWYYDYKENQCLEFDYSGCKGNENKFFQKQKCIDSCVTRILNL